MRWRKDCIKNPNWIEILLDSLTLIKKNHYFGVSLINPWTFQSQNLEVQIFAHVRVINTRIINLTSFLTKWFPDFDPSDVPAMATVKLIINLVYELSFLSLSNSRNKMIVFVNFYKTFLTFSNSKLSFRDF